MRMHLTINNEYYTGIYAKSMPVLPWLTTDIYEAKTYEDMCTIFSDITMFEDTYSEFTIIQYCDKDIKYIKIQVDIK